jgi:hypothetical protein
MANVRERWSQAASASKQHRDHLAIKASVEDLYGFFIVVLDEQSAMIQVEVGVDPTTFRMVSGGSADLGLAFARPAGRAWCISFASSSLSAERSGRERPADGDADHR